MRGDRAGGHHFFSNIRDGKVTATGLEMLTPRRPDSYSGYIAYLFPTTIARHYPDTLHFSNSVVEIAKLPIHERDAKLQERKLALQYRNNPADLVLPSLRRHMHECVCQGLLRSARAALACERYRLQHDDWPATLDVLVQAKLLAVMPRDPIDNQPLRYRKTNDGIVIYSIGPDEKNDGGTIDRRKIERSGLDIGFRLWNSNLRRQPAIEALEGQ